MRMMIIPSKILNKLLLIILFLFILNSVGIFLRQEYTGKYINYFVYLFDFNSEYNIPTLYSTMALGVASLLLFAISFFKRKEGLKYLYWIGLGVCFLFLSMNELLSIHERLIKPLRDTYGLKGVFYYAWIIPCGVFFVIFGLLYLRFILNLPQQVWKLFVLAGSLFVLGAIGFEMLGGRYHEAVGDQTTLVYSMLYTCEELLEMIGVAVFIYALLLCLPKQISYLNLQLNKPERQTYQV